MPTKRASRSTKSTTTKSSKKKTVRRKPKPEVWGNIAQATSLPGSASSSGKTVIFQAADESDSRQGGDCFARGTKMIIPVDTLSDLLGGDLTLLKDRRIRIALQVEGINVSR